MCALALNADADTDPLLHDRRKRYAGVLRKELARLNRSLISVLDQTTSMGEARERFDLREVIRDLEALLAPQATLRQIVLAVHLPDREVPLVGRRDRLKQALLNIASNALEAMPNGGELNIDVRKTSDGFGAIFFRDTGIGMSEEEKAQIFQPFHSGFKGGHGLGLSIIFQIMEEHGARISFESEKGKGTKVSLRFPLQILAIDAEDMKEAVVQA